VWRIKYIEQQDILLMACMQDGVKVVQFNSTSSMSIIDEMRENHSLAYGIDGVGVRLSLELQRLARFMIRLSQYGPFEYKFLGDCGFSFFDPFLKYCTYINIL